MAHCLSQPSSCEEEVFKIIGYVGHGINGVRASDGFGKSSNCVTDNAPCLLDVPTQSLPVSPPPMTTTCLPFALSSW